MLLFVDWPDGTLLHLQGDVEIFWGHNGGFAWAERLWRVFGGDAWRGSAAAALRWTFRDYAPQLQ